MKVAHIKKIFVLIVSFCTYIFSVEEQRKNDTCNIFVFVHGTYNPQLLLSLGIRNTYHVLRGKENQKYEKANNEARQQVDVTKKMMTNIYGLHEIPFCFDIVGASSALEFFVCCLEYFLKKNDHALDRKYFIYNWSGLLSEKARNDAGKRFLYDLEHLYTEQKKVYKNVSITLVSHSHGGNVSLSMIDYYDKNHFNLQVENLILLGTPIYPRTAYRSFISNRERVLFKNIFNFYSKHDWVQVSDVSVPKASLLIGSHQRLHSKYFRKYFEYHCKKDPQAFDFKLSVVDATEERIKSKKVSHFDLYSINWKHKKLPYSIYILFFILDTLKSLETSKLESSLELKVIYTEKGVRYFVLSSNKKVIYRSTEYQNSLFELQDALHLYEKKVDKMTYKLF